jgi:serine protease AprX
MQQILTGLVIFSGLTTAAFGQGAHVARELRQASSESNVEVIVQFKQAPNAGDFQLLRDLGGVLKASLSVIQSASYSIPATSLPSLAANPNVLSISPNRRVRMLLDNTTAAVNALAGWSIGLDGSGIGIAVIDSGIAAHDDLKGGTGSRVVYHESFIDNSGSVDFGHGEHVAGILAGNGADSNCPACTRHLTGLAPNANLVDLQVLDQNGEGTDAGVIAAINRAMKLQS